MAITTIIFDIGGVLELTPDTGWREKWEQRLALAPGELQKKMFTVWRAGSIGELTLPEVEQETGRILQLEESAVKEIMDDIWVNYLGTLNVELNDYFIQLRPRYQTAILSNSFVGAREREQAHYQFEDHCDLIIYSHEVGLQKPDPQIYHLTEQQVGARPEEIIFLDDAAVNVAAAQARGWQAVQFLNTAQAIGAINDLLDA